MLRTPTSLNRKIEYGDLGLMGELLTDTEGATHDYSVSQGRVREHLIRRQGAIAEKVLPEVTTNATALSESLRGHGSNVAAALKTWEPAQLRLGKRLEEHGKSLGDSSQFDR
jgi:hypothetical protein